MTHGTKRLLSASVENHGIVFNLYPFSVSGSRSFLVPARVTLSAFPAGVTRRSVKNGEASAGSLHFSPCRSPPPPLPVFRLRSGPCEACPLSHPRSHLLMSSGPLALRLDPPSGLFPPSKALLKAVLRAGLGLRCPLSCSPGCTSDQQSSSRPWLPSPFLHPQVTSSSLCASPPAAPGLLCCAPSAADQ